MNVWLFADTIMATSLVVDLHPRVDLKSSSNLINHFQENISQILKLQSKLKKANGGTTLHFNGRSNTLRSYPGLCEIFCGNCLSCSSRPQQQQQRHNSNACNRQFIVKSHFQDPSMFACGQKWCSWHASFEKVGKDRVHFFNQDCIFRTPTVSLIGPEKEIVVKRNIHPNSSFWFLLSFIGFKFATF